LFSPFILGKQSLGLRRASHGLETVGDEIPIVPLPADAEQLFRATPSRRSSALESLASIKDWPLDEQLTLLWKHSTVV